MMQSVDLHVPLCRHYVPSLYSLFSNHTGVSGAISLLSQLKSCLKIQKGCFHSPGQYTTVMECTVNCIFG